MRRLSFGRSMLRFLSIDRVQNASGPRPLILESCPGRDIVDANTKVSNFQDNLLLEAADFARAAGPRPQFHPTAFMPVAVTADLVVRKFPWRLQDANREDFSSSPRGDTSEDGDGIC